MSAPMWREMVDHIIAQFHPRRVVLFGSHAMGTADSDSDVDFLVVSDSPVSTHEQALAIRRSLGLFPVACDIIVKTPEDFQRQRGVVNHIVYFADRYGKTVYEG